MAKHVEILFVRHGQPAWARDDVPQMDPELTELGEQQAMLVAERLGKGGASSLVTSPAVRARSTAAPLAQRLGLEPEVVEDLLEFQLPDWSRLTMMEVALKFREARSREPHEWWDGLDGGEKFRDFHARVQRGLSTVLRSRGVTVLDGHDTPIFQVEQDFGRLVVFGHGGTNAVAMNILLGVPCVPWEWERFAIAHAGFVRLKAIPLGRGRIFSLRAFNDCEHLPREMRST